MRTSKKIPTRAKLIKMWVAALRSGKYEQAEGTLREVERDFDDASGEEHVHVRYCCLGVACEVAREAGLPIEEMESKPGEIRTDTVYFRKGTPKRAIKDRSLRKHQDVDSSELPRFVAEAFGIQRDGTLTRAGGGGGRRPKYESLVSANDDGESFAKIADRIERGQLAEKEGA